MRLLANENVPAEAVEVLRDQGHDIAWAREQAPGSSDQAVLDRARSEARILVTFDKDFGELAFRARLPAECGIILLRIRAPSSEHIARFLAQALASRQDWPGHFAVIEDDRIRFTPLPGSTG